MAEDTKKHARGREPRSVGERVEQRLAGAGPGVLEGMNTEPRLDTNECAVLCYFATKEWPPGFDDEQISCEAFHGAVATLLRLGLLGWEEGRSTRHPVKVSDRGLALWQALAGGADSLH